MYTYSTLYKTIDRDREARKTITSVSAHEHGRHPGRNFLGHRRILGPGHGDGARSGGALSLELGTCKLGEGDNQTTTQVMKNKIYLIGPIRTIV